MIGLTGGIATGKSTVSTLFKQRGIPVIDADVLARKVVLPGTRAYAAIVATFGSDILQPDGYLNRAALGARVFADATERARLNAIVHPAVRRAMIWDVMRCWLRGERMCVVDVPLLIEAGLWRWVAKVVVVYWCVRMFGPLVGSDGCLSFSVTRTPAPQPRPTPLSAPPRSSCSA